MRACLAAVLLLAGCATTGPSGGEDDERPSYRTRILAASIAGGVLALFIARVMTEDVEDDPPTVRLVCAEALAVDGADCVTVP